VYTYPPITMGFKAGPSPPEARLAEQAAVEAEPAEPDSKTLPLPRHTIEEEEEETREEEDGTDCEVVESQVRVAEEEKDERWVEERGCCTPESRVPGLASRPPPAPIPEPACPPIAAGHALKVELSPGCPGQKVNLEEPQLTKEQEDDEEHNKEDEEEEEGETIGPEPTECTVSVCGEEEEEEEEEEGGDENGVNVEVVEDEEEEKGSGASPGEAPVELKCTSPAPSSSSSSSSAASTPARLQGAYMWSLELLIAAALCATRDALYLPAAAARAPSPPPHRGMEILGEVAELEIQQRSREEDPEGEENTSPTKTMCVFPLVAKMHPTIKLRNMKPSFFHPPNTHTHTRAHAHQM